MKQAIHATGNKLFETRQHVLSSDYYLFNLSGGRKKVKAQLSDILALKAIKGGNHDKLLNLKGSITYRVRKCKFADLMRKATFFLQVNKSTLISAEVVKEIDEDNIELSAKVGDNETNYVTLAESTGKHFLISLNDKKIPLGVVKYLLG